MRVEIYDERSFTKDEIIGVGTYGIPNSVYEGIQSDVWVELRSPTNSEIIGTIRIILSFRPNNVNSTTVINPQNAPNLLNSPSIVDENTRQKHMQELSELFSHLDAEILESVYENNSHDLDKTINALLALNE